MSNPKNFNRDKLGRGEFLNAVIDNNISLIKRLLEEGVDVNEVDKNGWSALHFAAQNYSGDVVKLLLSSGADINAVDFYGNTPLFKAVFNSPNKDLTVLDLFINAGADLSKKNKSGVSVIDLINTINSDKLKDFLKNKQ